MMRWSSKTSEEKRKPPPNKRKGTCWSTKSTKTILPPCHTPESSSKPGTKRVYPKPWRMKRKEICTNVWLGPFLHVKRLRFWLNWASRPRPHAVSPADLTAPSDTRSLPARVARLRCEPRGNSLFFSSGKGKLGEPLVFLQDMCAVSHVLPKPNDVSRRQGSHGPFSSTGGFTPFKAFQ